MKVEERFVISGNTLIHFLEGSQVIYDTIDVCSEYDIM